MMKKILRALRKIFYSKMKKKNEQKKFSNLNLNP